MRTKLAAAVVLTAALILAPAAPAAADPRPAPAPGQPRQGLSRPAPDAAAAEVLCWANAAPVPQYSSSGGTSGTVHYGAQIICNTVGTLWFELKLYTVVGSGDRERKVWQETRPLGPRVDYAMGNSWFEPCFGNASTRWVTSRRPTWNGYPFDPPVQWTSVITLPCGSGD